MSEYWTIADTTRRFSAGEITARTLVDQALARIAAIDPKVDAYLAVDEAGARAAAEALDAKRGRGEPCGVLAGATIALKDMIVTKGLATTAGSKILESYVPPYDATVASKLRSAGAIIVGKVNCDEFGMGSSTENSAYKTTKNPWDLTRVPGGSSGGSSAAVAAGMCTGSLGTDTGGSIRQPAAFCGIVGIKPTYGRVSRWGVVAYASSLDQVGPMARTVGDAAVMLEAIAGFDPRDSTSLMAPVPKYSKLIGDGVAGLRVGIPSEYFQAELDGEIRSAVERARDALRDAGASIVEISLPHTYLALPAYYLVAPSEASSNLSRYDGVRYGKRAKADTLQELYMRSRGRGFGPEVKRRIMLGTYALRSGYYDAYYKKAQQVRALIKGDFEFAFGSCDVVLTPTAPTAAFPLGSKSTPMEMYLGDIYTLSCNLAGLPGISVPCGLTATGLPIGAQLLGKPLDEATLFRTARVIEERCGLGDQRPLGLDDLQEIA